MKRFVSLLLMAAMLFSLCACGGGSSGDAQSGEPTQSTSTEETTKTGLTPENTLVIEGEEYALPFPAEELINAGWTGAFADNAFDPNKGGVYPWFPTKKDGNIKIKSIGFFNNSDISASLDKCTVTSLTLIGDSPEDSKYTCSFTLPGGITEKSTYQEVLAAYGADKYSISDGYEASPKDPELYNKYGFSVMFRAKDKTSIPYHYNFYFNADCSIKTVEIESTNYQAAALGAFDN